MRIWNRRSPNSNSEARQAYPIGRKHLKFNNGSPPQRNCSLYNSNGRQPFAEWLDSLKDSIAQDRVEIRIARVRRGNLGNYRSVGKGVCELKIDYGPGYRVYFGQLGSTIVVLLCGGDKSSQAQNIFTAQEYWSDYITSEYE